MTANASGAERQIVLLPLEGAESVPLRRWFGREAWLRDRIVTLCYKQDGDRILFQVVDTPSVASGFYQQGQPADLDNDFFIGFDGVTGAAWPTTIALLGFGRHLGGPGSQPTSQLSVLAELVGGTALHAARALRLTVLQAARDPSRTPDGDDRARVQIPPEEAAALTRHWGDLVVSSDEALSDEALAEWLRTAATGKQASPGDRRMAEPVTLVASGPRRRPSGEPANATPGAAPRAQAPAPSSDEGGLYSGGYLPAPVATGAGASMARISPRTPATRDKEPAGAIRYGLLARLADIWAARRDGNAVMPPLWSADGMTPYMEVRNRHFRDWAEREYQRMLAETAQLKTQQAHLRQQIAEAERGAAAVRGDLAAMGTTPANLDHQNVIEKKLKTDPTLTRSRRRLEFNRERGKALAREQAARRTVAELAAQEAELAEAISAHERIFHARVRQLLQHSLRRCAAYMQHIVHYHPDGAAVIPCLQLALPSEPKWLRTEAPGEPYASGPIGPAGPLGPAGANGAGQRPNGTGGPAGSAVDEEAHDAQL